MVILQTERERKYDENRKTMKLSVNYTHLNTK